MTDDPAVTEQPNPSTDADDPCEGCGDGDKVPAEGYFRCPVCDAEWDDSLGDPAVHAHLKDQP